MSHDNGYVIRCDWAAAGTRQLSKKAFGGWLCIGEALGRWHRTHHHSVIGQRQWALCAHRIAAGAIMRVSHEELDLFFICHLPTLRPLCKPRSMNTGGTP
jgi:hypothetical protein